MSKVCATCHHFSIKDPDDPAKTIPQAAHGIGRCRGFDGHVAPVEPFVRWDGPFCVAYGQAADIGKRNAWISARKLKEQEEISR